MACLPTLDDSKVQLIRVEFNAAEWIQVSKWHRCLARLKW